MAACSIENIGGATQHARRSCADLNKVGADWFAGTTNLIRPFPVVKIWYPPIEHGIESSNLIYPHGGHLQELGNIIHHTDTCPAFILSLPEIKKRNHSRLLVLRRVTGNDFLRPFLVRRIKFEKNLGE